MAYEWIKMWTDARRDAKLASLQDDEHRTWFNLLLFAADQDERGTIQFSSDRILAVEVCNGDIALLNRTLAVLEELEIISRFENIIDFKNFAKRQRGDHWARVEWNRLRAKIAPLIYARDGRICANCSATTNLSIDHIFPIARGGTNAIDNLRVLCRSCNSSKGARA